MKSRPSRFHQGTNGFASFAFDSDAGASLSMGVDGRYLEDSVGIYSS